MYCKALLKTTMNNQINPLETLTEIRSLMERSTKFISLSGLSGVCAGVFALVGALAAYTHLQSIGNPTLSFNDNYLTTVQQLQSYSAYQNSDSILFFALDAILVLIASLVAGSFFTLRKAKKNNQVVWDSTSKRLLVHLALPLVVGGIFCIALLINGCAGLVAPATLLFYGLALINASKYTLHDIFQLGVLQIILGLIATFLIGYGLLFWAIGFGVFHIVYGIVMYSKYER